MKVHQSGAVSGTARKLFSLQSERLNRQLQAFEKYSPVDDLPPEIDFLAITQEDTRLIALILAIRKVADQNGQPLISQLQTWTGGGDCE